MASETHLLLLGGGHAHAVLLQALSRRPLVRTRVTLLSDGACSAYSGMVPGYVAGVYTKAEIHFDLRRLCGQAGATFVAGSVVGLDPTARRVTLASGAALTYDLLSLNVGIASPLAAVPGASLHAVPVKPVESLLAGVDALTAGAASRPSPAVVIVGAGAGGIELALSLRAHLGPAGALTLVEAKADIVPGQSARLRRYLLRELAAKQVQLRLGVAPLAVTPTTLRLSGGEQLSFDQLFWATQGAPHAWVAESGLAVDAAGFVRVKSTLQSLSHPEVFAAGDAAMIEGYRLPRAGVYAVRAGRPLAANLRRRVAGKPLRPYRPQRHALALIGTGDGAAVAVRGGCVARGRWLWLVKGWIDRRFMRRLGTPTNPLKGTTR